MAKILYNEFSRKTNKITFNARDNLSGNILPDGMDKLRIDCCNQKQVSLDNTGKRGWGRGERGRGGKPVGGGGFSVPRV